MAQSWDRLPGESLKAFTAFAEYLRLGPQRSQDAAAQAVHKSPGTLRKWSERFGWVKRAEDYDAFVIGQERELALVVTRERAVVWAKRQEEARELEWELSQGLIGKAKELLHSGKVRWSGRDVYMMLDIASKLQRLATGMATERRQEEVVGPDGGPVQVQVDISAALKKVYGEVIDANAGDARLLEGGKGGGLSAGSDGSVHPGGDRAAAEAIGGECSSEGL